MYENQVISPLFCCASVIRVYMCVYIYIYIYIYRERKSSYITIILLRFSDTGIYVYIYIYILKEKHTGSTELMFVQCRRKPTPAQCIAYLANATIGWISAGAKLFQHQRRWSNLAPASDPTSTCEIEEIYYK